MKVTILLPITNNQGIAFPDAVMEGVLKDLAVEFDGCSTDGQVKGRSIEDGTMYCDSSLRVTIVCPKERLEELRRRVIEIGRQLEQIRMYFEVRDYDGVQFLSTSSNSTAQ